MTYPPLLDCFEIELKEGVNPEDFRFMHPNLFIVFAAFFDYASMHNLPVVITSMKSDIVEDRVSTTHREGRAIDCRSRGWGDFHINRVVYHINKRFEHVGAISYSDHKSRAIVYHDVGNGQHFHLQVRPGNPSFFWEDQLD